MNAFEEYFTERMKKVKEIGNPDMIVMLKAEAKMAWEAAQERNEVSWNLTSMGMVLLVKMLLSLSPGGQYIMQSKLGKVTFKTTDDYDSQGSVEEVAAWVNRRTE